MFSSTHFLATDRRAWLRLFITKTVASNFFFTPFVKRSWSFYMMGKCTLMNVYNIFSKKTIDFKAEPLMFLDLASCMKSLYSISQQYLHKAERTFPSSVSILKSFANGHFLKVAINTVSLLSSDIFSPKSWRERNN